MPAPTLKAFDVHPDTNHELTCNCGRLGATLTWNVDVRGVGDPRHQYYIALHRVGRTWEACWPHDGRSTLGKATKVAVTYANEKVRWGGREWQYMAAVLLESLEELLDPESADHPDGVVEQWRVAQCHAAVLTAEDDRLQLSAWSLWSQNWKGTVEELVATAWAVVDAAPGA